MTRELIQWPNEAEATRSANDLYRASGFPQAFAAIDCRENPIHPVGAEKDSYFKKKSFHSIKVQAVVNSDGQYIDIFVGWPGRSHNGYVLPSLPFTVA